MGSDPFKALSGGPLPGAESDGDPEGPRYRTTGLLGRGGMGRVDASEDRWLGREVALKVSHDPDLEVRLRAEARITAQLEHPGIVPVYDMGRTEDGQLFYTMRLVRGRSLEEAISAASTPAHRMALVRHVLDVGHAIAFAHAKGIIHRDLKPANILVGSYGETQVADWGLGTQAGAVESGPVGTPGWMAPEQVRGASDRRSDVWALGCILRAVGLEDVPELHAIAARATLPEPDARYPDAKGFTDDLAAFLDGRGVGAHTYSSLELARRVFVAWRPWILAGVAAALGITVAAAVAWERTSRQFARTLVRDAQHALEAGDLPEAAVLAAHSASRTADPQALGVLAAVHAVPNPIRKSHQRLPPCVSVSTTTDGAACVGPQGRVSWVGRAEALEHADAVVAFADGRFVAQDGGRVLRGDPDGAEVLIHTPYPFRWARWGDQAVGWAHDKLIIVPRSGPAVQTRECPVRQGLLALGTAGDALVLVCGAEVQVHRGADTHVLPMPEAEFGKINAVAVFGDRAALGTLDGRVLLWDLEHGAVGTETDAGVGPIGALVTLPHGLAVLGQQSGLRLLDPETLTLLAALPDRAYAGVESVDGEVVTWGESRTVWGMPETLRPRVFEFGSGVSSVDVHTEGRWLVTTHGNGRAVLTDATSGAQRSTEPLIEGSAAKWAAFDPSGRSVVVALPYGGAQAVNVPGWTARPIDAIGASRRVGYLGAIAAFVKYRDGVWTEDDTLLSGKTIVDASFTHPGGAFLDDEGNVWSGSGTLLLSDPEARCVGIARDGEVAVGTRIGVVAGSQRLPTASSVLRVELTDTLILAGTLGGLIEVWTRSGEPVAILDGHDERVVDLTVHGDALYSASWDGSVRVWDLAVLTRRVDAHALAASWGMTLDEILQNRR